MNEPHDHRGSPEDLNNVLALSTALFTVSFSFMSAVYLYYKVRRWGKEEKGRRGSIHASHKSLRSCIADRTQTDNQAPRSRIHNGTRPPKQHVDKDTPNSYNKLLLIRYKKNIRQT
jgi:hypothetical protein